MILKKALESDEIKTLTTELNTRKNTYLLLLAILSWTEIGVVGFFPENC
jgi:hypothetical protein